MSPFHIHPFHPAPKIHINLPPPLRVPPIKKIHLPPPPIHIPNIKLPPPIRVTPLPTLKPIHIDKPKIDMPALKIATGIILGLVNLTPMGKLASTAIMGAADAGSHGAASNFINNGHQVNSTLSFLPGGMLAQQVANDASNGRSGDVLGKYVPDPKKMAINGVIKVGETVVTNPKSTLGVTRDLARNDSASVKNIGNNYKKKAAPVIGGHKSTIPHTIVNTPSQISVVKPSLYTSILPTQIKESVSTLSFSDPVLSQKPSIIAAIFQTISPSISQTVIPESVSSQPSIEPSIISSTLPQVMVPTSASIISPIINMSTLGISNPTFDTQPGVPPPPPFMIGVMGLVCLVGFMLL